MTEDPTDALANLFDSMEMHVRRAGRTAHIDERVRLSLLLGHACFGIVVGPAFALLSLSGMTSPSFVLLRRVPGNPWSMAAVIFVAGIVLAVATWHRQRAWEYAALVAMLMWYGIVAVSLAGAVVLWLAAPGPPDWTKSPSIYAPLIYSHLCYALVAHARAIRKKGLRRPRQPE